MDKKVMGYHMWVILNPFPDKYPTHLIISHISKPREVLVEVLPLYVSYAKSKEDRYSIREEEASLCLEATALIPPEQTYTTKSRTLTDNMWEEVPIYQQGIYQLFTGHVL
jgi:hypothetical protein